MGKQLIPLILLQLRRAAKTKKSMKETIQFHWKLVRSVEKKESIMQIMSYPRLQWINWKKDSWNKYKKISPTQNQSKLGYMMK